jgi:hypothetical protein
MIDKQWENQAKKENRLPVSQLAKRLLKQNDQRPDLNGLAVLQLVQWVVSQGKSDMNQTLQEVFQELNASTPSQASQFLNLKSMSATAENARELVNGLADELDLVLSEHLEGYPPLPVGSYR